MSEVLQYRFPDDRAGDGERPGRPRARQPADRGDDRGRGRRLRGRHPADEPDPRRPRPGPAGLADAAHPPRAARPTGPSSTASRTIMRTTGIERVWITPDDVEASEDALAAIAEAELIVLGPGQPVHEPPAEPPDPGHPRRRPGGRARRGSSSATSRRRTGETTGFDLAAHVEALVAHTSPNLIDIVLANNQLLAGPRRRAGAAVDDADAPRPVQLRWPPAVMPVAAADPRRRRRPGQRPPPRPGPPGDRGHLARSRARSGSGAGTPAGPTSRTA